MGAALLTFLASMALLSHAALAALDLGAGKAKVQAVCAACHGANGASVSETIPNLAGQRATYLETQLRAWKDGSRKNPVVNAIGAQLAPEEMANVAAYFASLPGVQTAAKSEMLPALVKTQVAFPEGYKTSYTRYHTINFPATRQVRHYNANPAALQAARNAVPDTLRNENWNYAVFTTTKQLRPADQGECLACHKPLDKTGYTFTLEQLTAVAKAR